MNMKGNLQNSMANPKSRVFLFVMITIIIFVSFIAFLTRNKQAASDDADTGVVAQSNITTPSLQIDSIAGISEPTPDYMDLQAQKEKQQAQNALSDSGMPSAALPSLSIGSESIPDLNLGSPNDSYNTQLAKQLQDQQTLQQKMLANQKNEYDMQQEDIRNKQVQAILGRQVQLLAQNWQTIPQTYVQGSIESYPKLDNVAMIKEARKGSDTPEQPKIFYKAGDILFGVILTSINSDEPSPILARIISGPLANAKIIGSINPTSIPQTANAPRVSKSLILEFSLLNIPGGKVSVPVSAVAIDPQTARTRLATSVDNHYMLRYGTFFAASFLSGLGQAISEQNQNRIITDLGSQVHVGSDKLRTQDELKIAVGRTTEALTKSMNFLQTPPTIKIASGTAVGILLQQDLVIGSNEDINTKLLVGNNRGINNIAVQPDVANAQPLNPLNPLNNVYGSSAGQPVVVP